MAEASEYYNSAVKATEEFLGPAAERFINRQVQFHLSKKPETIDRNDVIKLKNSVGAALGLLTNDKQIVDRAQRKFDEIANQKVKNG